MGDDVIDCCWHQDIAVQFKEFGIRKMICLPKIRYGPGLTVMLPNSIHIQTVWIIDRTIYVADSDYYGPLAMHQLRSPITYISESLNDYSDVRQFFTTSVYRFLGDISNALTGG